MDVPEALQDVDSTEILNTLQKYMVLPNKIVRVNHPKSIYSKTAEIFTKRTSTINERKYVYALWNDHVKKTSAQIVESSTTDVKTHKQKNQQHNKKKKTKSLILMAEYQHQMNKLAKKNKIKGHQEKVIENSSQSSSKEDQENTVPSPTSKRKERSPEKRGFIKRLRHGLKQKVAGVFFSTTEKTHHTSNDIQTTSGVQINNVDIPHNDENQSNDSLNQLLENIENDQWEPEPQIINEEIKQLIEGYIKSVHTYPSYVCPICKRFLYNNTKHCTKPYVFTPNIIQQLYTLGNTDFITGQKLSFCRRCSDALLRNKIPPMAFFNKMEIPTASEKLLALNDVEMKFISQIHPFMKIYHLSKGQGQLALKGTCIHFPQSVDELVETLPLNKDSANLLIINETGEKNYQKKHFQVRPNLLYDALKWLKEMNPLYRNISIQTIEEDQTLIPEVICLPENEMQPHHKIDRPVTGYKRVSDCTEILRGSLHQCSQLFNNLDKSFCIALTAIAFSVNQSPATWTSHELDSIIYAGCIKHKNADCHPNVLNQNMKIPISITLHGLINILIQIDENHIIGYFNKVPGAHLTRLTAGLEHYFNSESQNCVIKIGKSYLSLIKCDGFIFLIDPFSRGSRGKKAEKGTACVIKCQMKTAVSFISAHIHRNFQPNNPFSKDLNISQKQLFEFSLHFFMTERTHTSSETANQETDEVGSYHNEVSYNVNEVSSNGYITISNSRSILRADFHQSTIQMFPDGGTQCAAMSASAAAHTLLRPPSDWKKCFLNNILLCGDKFYSNLVTTRDTMLEATELSGILKCFGNAEVRCRVTLNQVYAGSLNNVPGEITRLSTSVHAFLLSDYNNAILTCNGYCIALLKEESDVYVFDSHSRDENGWPHPDGKACVNKFFSEEVSEHVSDYVHRICAPNIPYSHTMTEMQKQVFNYTIRPIMCTLTKAADASANEGHTETEAPNINQSTNTHAVPIDKVRHFTTPAINAPTHQISVMLDCVIRLDEPDVPCLKSFIDGCRKGETEIREVNLQRQQARPLYPNTEQKLEELAFVKALPFGQYGCNEERIVRITPLDYFQQRLMGTDKNFHSTEYLFYALSRVEAHTIHQKIAVCGNMVNNNGQVDLENDVYYPNVENVHLYMGSVRGSGSYWKKYTGDVLGMIEQLNCATFFITISYDDLNSVDSLTALWKAKNGVNSELPAEELPFEVRRELLNDYPVAAARHFNHRINIIMSLFKKNGQVIFGGNVVDFTYRVEFQGRGSPHVHMLVWIENAPKWETPEGISFLNNNVSCSLNVPYKELVVRYQSHSHRSTCYKKHDQCRFGFPRKPSDDTRILDDEEISKMHGRFVEIKRAQDETMINNYHPMLLQVLKCNMDIQPVTGTRAIAYYIGKYMSKGEPTYLRDEIRSIITNCKADSTRSFYQKAQAIANVVIKHRKISAQECAFRLLHLRLRNSSRLFVFVPAFQPQNRVRLIRRDTILSDEPSMGLNVIDRYFNRPDSLEQLCLLEFAAWWVPKKNTNNATDEDNLEDGDIDEEFAELQTTRTVKLKNNKGYICKRKRHAVVRYPMFRPLEQTDDYLYSMIILHTPLRNEDFLPNYSSITEAFNNLKSRFRSHEDDTIINPDQVTKINAVLDQLNEPDVPDVNADDDADYNMFEVENDEPLRQEEIFVNPASPETHPLNERVAMLTSEQRNIYERVRRHIVHPDKNVLHLLVQGCGGTGKSFLIDLLTELIQTLCSGRERSLIKAAPTGVASRNISAVTIHRAFSLGVEQHSVAQYMKLGGRLLQERRKLYKDVKWLILDEYSMISFEVFRQIHLRCTELFGNNEPFGNLNVIILGDMLQLAPCRGHWIFAQPSYLSHEQNLWDLFEFYELKTVMRQRQRDHFFEFLQRLRLGTVVKADTLFLQQRLLNPLSENYDVMLAASKDSLHLYPKVKQVDEYNNLRLLEYQRPGRKIYYLTAQDTYGCGMKFGAKLEDNLVFADIRKCAGVPTTVQLAVDCRVMLKWNIDPLGGLCNGSIGTVRKFQWTALRRDQLQVGDLPESVLVEFDGEIAERHFSNIPGFERCVEVKRRTFEFSGKRGIKVHRRQIPLLLCFATTFHKAQGMSLNACTLYMGRHIFKQGQLYVGISRVRTIGGLCITELDDNKLLVNKHGTGPTNDKPLRELTRLNLMSFLDYKVYDIDIKLLSDLVSWCIEYVMCHICKEWICLCICQEKKL